MALTNHDNMASTSDIHAAGWWRILPRPLQGAALLSRWDRPVGTWLLLWPALWGLLVGHAGFPPVLYIVIFVLGALLMRGAGCTINDLLDRDLDGAVARTSTRPLPAGLIAVRGAWVWLAVQLALAALLLFILPRDVWLWGLAALPLIMLYPLMKRITWWPQVWLGLTFNWGLWLGLASGAAFDAQLLPMLLMYIGALLWTVGYDTIYAAQDADDDALIGVRSTARLFGRYARLAVALCYAAALALWVYAAWYMGLSAASLAGFAVAGVLLAWQFRLWRGGSAGARNAFVSNIRAGGAVALALWLGYAL